jgi:(p)ppGpp synthase/HD superfamily hydrolase
MTPRERARFVRALRFALAAHGAQRRKGKQVPYASHLVSVAGLVLEHGGDADQAIAGLLHDAIEDCDGVSEESLRASFGPEVARMVRALSDVLEGDSPSRKSAWVARKRRFVVRLRREDARVRLVAACDKLDNMRSLVADLHAEGPATLGRFRGTPAQLVWYFGAVRRALGSGLPAGLLRELDARLAELARLVPDGRAPDAGGGRSRPSAARARPRASARGPATRRTRRGARRR